MKNSYMGDVLKNPVRNILITMLLALSLFTLIACHSTDNENSQKSGDLIIQLTDAEGDFTNYTVDVVSISLTKANNTQVEALPENTRVDFSQYVEMTELLTAASIPSGIYKAVSLTLNYSNSEIYVENSAGDSVKVDNITDEDGAIVTTLETQISFDETKPLLIAQGIPALLSLDFDLKTSNVVSFDDAGVPSVIVSPNLDASLEQDQNKEHRIRGPLKSVNVDDASFNLIIRPFHHRIDSDNARFGNIKISTSNETIFDINGTSYTGQDGINVMSELVRLTGVIAKGTVNIDDRTFNATEVYVGSSVPGGNMDAVKGTVLSRVNNNITVKGATLIRSGGSVLFQNTIVITVDDTTLVKRQHDAGDYDISAISVGQKVTIFGRFNNDFAEPAFDASQGIVHLNVTTVTGTVVSNSSNNETDEGFAIDIHRLNGKKPDMFDFTGTGVDTESDADPDFYEIETTVLDISNFPNNLPVKVMGFINHFGSAPADFSANSITGYHEVKAAVNINWVPASATAFSSISSDKMTVSFAGTGRFHHLSRGRQHFDLTQLESEFNLIPGEVDQGLYIIKTLNEKHVHSTFANFSADVEGLLTQGSTVKRIRSVGKYETLTGNFTAKKIELYMR